MGLAMPPPNRRPRSSVVLVGMVISCLFDLNGTYLFLGSERTKLGGRAFGQPAHMRHRGGSRRIGLATREIGGSASEERPQAEGSGSTVEQTRSLVVGIGVKVGVPALCALAMATGKLSVELGVALFAAYLCALSAWSLGVDQE
eukprot:TRINITY_DN71843_c0_g1_i1.p1 TRINITY_DN71843_c0_g1~~TRINITY_DN71843_c0_g1_i1.p1  ORF type:complete len:162 (+),score=7.39 TRINITY_DN71843_c0_g1_i1:55-486(+)